MELTGKSGVYRIRNSVNNKGDVGSTVNFEKRWSEHKRLLRSNRFQHHSPHLQRAWNKYGEENFIFEVLELCEPTKEKLLPLEQIWMDSLCSYLSEYGYNICRVAGSRLGSDVSDETKKKISDCMKGERNPNVKLTRKKVREIREKYLSGKYSRKDLSNEYGSGNIPNILWNKLWIDETLGQEYLERVSEIVKSSKHLSPFGRAKLTWAKVRKIREKYLSGEYTLKELSEEYRVKENTLGSVVSNKAWVESMLNTAYSEKILKIKRSRCGEGHPRSKLTRLEAFEIREKYLTGKYTYEELSKEYPVNFSSIGRIVLNKNFVDASLGREYFQKISQIRAAHPAGSKLSWIKVREIREKYLSGKYTYDMLAKEYAITLSNVGYVVTNKTWREEKI